MATPKADISPPTAIAPRAGPVAMGLRMVALAAAAAIVVIVGWQEITADWIPGLDGYSYRRATIGSRRAALRAGQRPKNSPTLTATTKPVMTDQRGTVEGRLGTRLRMARLSNHPSAMPAVRRRRSGTWPRAGTAR